MVHIPMYNHEIQSLEKVSVEWENEYKIWISIIQIQIQVTYTRAKPCKYGRYRKKNKN